jgi:acetyl-CoA acetyltransferase
VNNPYSQFRKTFTIEEVLAAPPITYPLTLPMCAPLTDGAAAAILCTEEGLKRIGADRNRCIKVLASVMRSATSRSIEDKDKHITLQLARQAYEMAGLGPEDMDVAEVHDATAMGEITQSESLGLAPLGATGIGQLFELVAQLRGEAGARQVAGARHAIQENGGGLQGIEEAAVAVHILSR